MNDYNEPVARPSEAASGFAVEESQLSGQPATGITAAGSEILPYVVPMFAYVGLSSLEGYLPQVMDKPSPTWYPIAYAAKLVVVAALAWYFRVTWRDFRPAPTPGKVMLGVLTGLFVCLAWVGLDGHYPAMPSFLGEAARHSIHSCSIPVARWGFMGVRLLGLVLVVPLIEELFWRSFLLRWLIDSDFWKVPIGKVTPMAAAVTSVLFALAHPEWLPAVLTGALWAWLLWWTAKRFSACAVSHATANSKRLGFECDLHP